MSSVSNVALQANVLVLNRLYMAVQVISVRRALGMLYKGDAEVVHVQEEGYFESFTFDRWLEPDCEQLGQFPHEAHAAAALVWLSHLQTHESEKRTPWSGVPFRSWHEDERAAWSAKRRTLWSGLLRQVDRYRAARRVT